MRHFKPLAFAVVLATPYGLLYPLLYSKLVWNRTHPAENVTSVYEKVIHWNLDHLAYAVLLLIVSTTIASYQVFKKQGYNLSEHLVLNAYYRCLVSVISLLLFPLLYVLARSDTEIFKGYALAFQF